MKRTRLRFIWFVIILAVLASILLYTRMGSTPNIKKKIYSQWSKEYVVTKDKLSYIRTTNSKTEDVVLSEAQGYGMIEIGRASCRERV